LKTFLKNFSKNLFLFGRFFLLFEEYLYYKNKNGVVGQRPTVLQRRGLGMKSPVGVQGATPPLG